MEAPRKDLNRIKRKRTQSTSRQQQQQQQQLKKKKVDDSAVVSTTTNNNEVYDFDYESLVASLTDSAIDEIALPLPLQQQPQQQHQQQQHYQLQQDFAVTSDLNNYSTDPLLSTLPAASASSTQVHYYVVPQQQQQQPLPPPPPPPLLASTSQQQQQTYYHHEQQQQQQPQQPSRHDWEPRLLLRQLYKVGNQADAVVGLECTRDYSASVYLVSTNSSVKLTAEDLLSVQNPRCVNAVNRYFNVGTNFIPFYYDTILVEPTNSGGGGGAGGTVAISNYTLRYPPNPLGRNNVGSGGGGGGIVDVSGEVVEPNIGGGGGGGNGRPDVTRHTTPVLLHVNGWNALKKLFGCIETYYRICVLCSPTIQSLIERYTQYFVKHYKSAVLLTSTNVNATASSLKIPSGTYQHINLDLPNQLRELDEKRIPAAAAAVAAAAASASDINSSLTTQQALLPWMDAEVRRFCAPNICGAVLQQLRYDYIRW